MHPVQEGRCRCFKGKACDRPAKHPMTPHGVNDATTDRNRINTWWTENPNANIGIATGSEAEILVLDIDPRNKGKETLARPHKELGPLPDTVTALTGGGEFTENFAYAGAARCVRTSHYLQNRRLMMPAKKNNPKYQTKKGS